VIGRPAPKDPIRYQEWKRKLGVASRLNAQRYPDFGFRGKHHTEGQKMKVSEKLKGKPSRKKGVPLSEETHRKMSLAQKGKP